MHATSARTGRTRRGLIAGMVSAFSLAAALALLALVATPQLALADEEEDELATTATRVEEANDQYVAATEHLAEVQQQMADNMTRIAELEEQLPAQRERTSGSIRTLYKIQQSTGGLLDLVLSSESFSTLISTLEYLNIISERNVTEVANLVSLSQELREAQTSLDAQRVEAETAKAEAEAALISAQEARTEAQQRAIAQAAAEAEAAAAALEAARAAAEAEESFTTASGNTVDVVVDDRPAGIAEATYDEEASEATSDDSEIVSGSVDEWAARIDAYLAGSELAGYGRNFAQAALTYGVDPRWSPAISCIETGKGNPYNLHYGRYNAWGWMTGTSWSSWEEGIDAHVRGLASGYGYTISVAAAQRYCPPNWQYWYSAVSSEMNRI